MFKLADDTKRLLDLFISTDYGTTLTYVDIVEKTGLDVSSEHRQRMYTVNNILERDHLRSIQNVRGVGYRVAHPREHVESISIRRRRAGRQISKASKTASATNISRLNSDESRELADAQVWVTRVEQALNFHDKRISAIEAKLGMKTDQEEVQSTAIEE